MNPSMSEKKSVLNTKYDCLLCGEAATDDFLELSDQSEFGFILCANCEAMSASEDLYEALNYDEEYGNSRESIFNIGLTHPEIY